VIYAKDVDTDVTTRVVVETEVTTWVVLTVVGTRLNVGTRVVRISVVVVGISDTTVTYMVFSTVTGEAD
jgi:hypothetical protein